MLVSAFDIRFKRAVRYCRHLWYPLLKCRPPFIQREKFVRVKKINELSPIIIASQTNRNHALLILNVN